MDTDMISAASGTWVVRVAGAVLGETSSALVLRMESGERVFFPPEDIAVAFLETSTSTVTDTIGTAQFQSIITKNGTLTDAVQSYASPNAGFEALAGYLTFQGAKVAVEQV